MINNNQIKYIKSLSLKKFRDLHKQFIVEGEKLLDELLISDFKIIILYVDNEISYNKYVGYNFEVNRISTKELGRISNFDTPNKCLALIDMPTNSVDIDVSNELSLVLDRIQDPGNLGTIIRIASWFGIKNIFCSTDTVDVYNPKVVQSTMGAIAYTKIHYTDLSKLLVKYRKNPEFNIYGTFLTGKNIYNTKLENKGFIIIGNEGSGISEEIENLVSQKLLIPSFNNSKVESLNAATATAIICSEFRRNNV